MTCVKAQQAIALWVEGDLVESGLQTHLESCEGCREFADGLRASQTALKDLSTESLDRAALEDVRARVLTEIAARQADRQAHPWRWAFAAAALVLTLAMSALWRVQTQPELESRPVAAKAPVVSPPAPMMAQVRQPRRSAPRRSRPMKAAEPLVIKMVTDDPNVVIVWLVDSDGGL